MPRQHLVQAAARRLDEAAEALGDFLGVGGPDEVVGGDVDEGVLDCVLGGLVSVVICFDFCSCE